MMLFAVLYIGEGIGQLGGLIEQPLTLHLLNDYNWTNTQIAAYFNLLSLPWVIKPLYGILTDFVPLLGYRRKYYLILANAAAAGGYLLLLGMTSPFQMGFALVLTAIGMAVSSTLCGAVLVENGKVTGLNAQFVSQQWKWFWIANVTASILGGVLCQYLTPGTAVSVAAIIISLVLLGVAAASWFWVVEEQAEVNWNGVRTGLLGIWRALSSRTLWIVGAFIFAYYFSPGFGTVMFTYMTKTLLFSQNFIGILKSINGLGHVAGAFLFAYLAPRMSFNRLVFLSIGVGALSQAAFVFLDGPTSAIILNFVNGVCTMTAVISVLTIAAEYCPDGTEGFTYALLMSVHDATTPLSNWAGAYLYDSWFSHHLTPLILVSGAVTALSLVLIPLMNLRREPTNRE